MVKALFVFISFLNKKCNTHGQYVSWARVLSNASTKPVNINDIGQRMLRLDSAVGNDHRKAPFPGGVCHHVEYGGIAVFFQKKKKKTLLHLENFTKGQKDFPRESPEVKTNHKAPQN